MVDPKAAQKRLFDRVVTQQLDKLEAAARGANAEDQVDESAREMPLCACYLFTSPLSRAFRIKIPCVPVGNFGQFVKSEERENSQKRCTFCRFSATTTNVGLSLELCGPSLYVHIA